MPLKVTHGERGYERPILFSGPMVRAILDGRKTQTRRVAKPQPTVTLSGCLSWKAPAGKRIPGGPRSCFGGRAVTATELIGEYCPHGQPGDRLWVRESSLFRSECGLYYARHLEGGRYEAWGRDGEPHWRRDDRGYSWDDVKQGVRPLEWQVGSYSAAMHGQKPGTFTLGLLRCDTTKIVEPYTGNTVVESRKVEFRRRVPGIHMPRWASRLTLEITEVRVQRLQEISEEDSIAEGVQHVGMGVHVGATQPHISPVKAYRDLWDSINGVGSWDANPWVWAITFRPPLRR